METAMGWKGLERLATSCEDALEEAEGPSVTRRPAHEKAQNAQVGRLPRKRVEAIPGLRVFRSLLRSRKRLTRKQVETVSGLRAFHSLLRSRRRPVPKQVETVLGLRAFRGLLRNCKRLIHKRVEAVPEWLWWLGIQMVVWVLALGFVLLIRLLLIYFDVL